MPDGGGDCHTVARAQANALVAIGQGDFELALNDVNDFGIAMASNSVAVVRGVVPLVSAKTLFLHLPGDDRGCRVLPAAPAEHTHSRLSNCHRCTSFFRTITVPYGEQRRIVMPLRLLM